MAFWPSFVPILDPVIEYSYISFADTIALVSSPQEKQILFLVSTVLSLEDQLFKHFGQVVLILLYLI